MAKRDSLTGPLSSPSSPDSFVNMKDSTTDKRSPVTALVVTTLKNNINWLRDLCYEFKVANDNWLVTVFAPLTSAVAANTSFRTAQSSRVAQMNARINPTPLGSYSTLQAAYDANPDKVLVIQKHTVSPGVYEYVAYHIGIV